MDVTPLRESRDFRLLFTAGTVFYLGGMVSYVAIPFQIYDLTGSNFLVGAVGLAELVPLIVFGLYGGALADHVDRRRLLIGTGVAQALLTAVLAVNAVQAIESGQKRSDEGAEQVVAAGQTLTRITQTIEAIRDMNRQIATAAEEQNAVVDDIAQNLVEITAIATTNQGNVDRTQAASSHLHQLSAELAQVTARIKAA